jgi:VanZ family protein
MSTPQTSTALRWVPALAMMVIIFVFSSLPATQVPYFGQWDVLIKKGGHALSYGLLGLAYYYALPQRLAKGYRWLVAFLMAILFALSDEFHQSFVEGRNSSIRDVLIDGLGAAIALTIGAIYPSNSSSKSIS